MECAGRYAQECVRLMAQHKSLNKLNEVLGKHQEKRMTGMKHFTFQKLVVRYIHYWRNPHSKIKPDSYFSRVIRTKKHERNFFGYATQTYWELNPIGRSSRDSKQDTSEQLNELRARKLPIPLSEADLESQDRAIQDAVTMVKDHSLAPHAEKLKSLRRQLHGEDNLGKRSPAEIKELRDQIHELRFRETYQTAIPTLDFNQTCHEMIVDWNETDEELMSKFKAFLVDKRTSDPKVEKGAKFSIETYRRDFDEFKKRQRRDTSEARKTPSKSGKNKINFAASNRARTLILSALESFVE